MENIYKIKIRSNPDPQGVYPSERRYSASTVLGLGVVHLALATTALLLALLSLSSNTNQIDPIIKISNYSNSEVSAENVNAEIINAAMIHQESLSQVLQDTQLSKSIDFHKSSSGSDVINSNTNLSLAPCILSLGALAAGLTGLLASKRWYIDNNIGLLFFMSLASCFTSTVCIIMTTNIMITVHEMLNQLPYDFQQKKPNVRFILALNILITCIVELIWSTLSAMVAFKGMRNTYPDDIIISRSRGKIEVNTVHKGNKKTRIMPPDILNHFPTSGKLAKHLAKADDGNLPKAESNKEYQERVRQFLCSNVEDISIK